MVAGYTPGTFQTLMEGWSLISSRKVAGGHRGHHINRANPFIASSVSREMAPGL